MHDFNKMNINYQNQRLFIQYTTVDSKSGICNVLEDVVFSCVHGECVGDIEHYELCKCDEGYGGFDCSVDLQKTRKFQY